MKKIFTVTLILLIILTLVGCSGGGGGSGNNGPRSGYYYMWSNGNSTPLAYIKHSPFFNSVNSVVYAEEPTPVKYLGSEIPPFASVDDVNRMCGFLLIFTYYNGAEVKSMCIVDPNDGEITEYDLSGGHMVPSFIAKRQGLFHITATYNGEILDIPVRIYHFGGTSLNYADLDRDGIYDIQNFIALYGYTIINHPYLSLVLSIPAGEYAETPLSRFEFGQIYIIKTSSGRYCKLWPTGYSGENNYYNMNFLSDENGEFAY